MANPRKFSEKIALHNQKQAEETAAFERIMQEVSVTRNIGPQPPPNSNHIHLHPQRYLRPYLGGSLPNVNQIATNPHMSFQPPAGCEETKPLMRHPGRLESRMRPYGFNHRRPHIELSQGRMVSLDGHSNQHPGSYLSPPPNESLWRRTNSDSALHKSVMNPTSQDPFNSNPAFHGQPRHESFETSRTQAPTLYKTIMEGKKLDAEMQLGNRPKSCDAPNMSRMPSGEVSGLCGHNNSSVAFNSNGSPANLPSTGLGLSHVTQIGNNTGSLPDLTNLHIPSPLIHPIDDDVPSPPHQSSNIQNTPLYNQTRNPSSGINPLLTGVIRRPASPGRSRRNAHNGPSPLILSSPDDGSRRVKFSNQGPPKIAASKTELKSPPLGLSYPNQKQSGTPGGRWPLPSPDHPGSPTYGQILSPPGNQAELTTSNNPALSEAYFRSDVQPLQHQFEQFHVVSEPEKLQRTTSSGVPSVYSALATLNETVEGLNEQGNSALFGSLQKHHQTGNSIPDIVFTGVDDSQSLRFGSMLNSSEFGSYGLDYFAGSDFRSNQYLEELQMLDEPNIDLAVEDQLHLDSI